MKIDAMVRREDFYRITEETLRTYYLDVYGVDTQIYTRSIPFLGDAFVYPTINAIVTRFPSRRVRSYIFSEFDVTNSLLKRLAAKLYTAMCLFSGGIAADKTLSFHTLSQMHNDILIWPCNRKIRVFDFDAGYVDSVVKDGFTRRYFNNELSFRLDSTYDFVLPVVDHGDDWYREAILPGQPLARIRDHRLYRKGLSDAVKYMGMIARDTLQYVDAASYSTTLYGEILTKMEIATNSKSINCYKRILETAEAALAEAVLLGAPIPTVDSHGDLQSGNVWVDVRKERTYIIDWETHGRRSIWYDCATILLSIRRANKLKEMMDKCETDAVREAVCANDSRKDYRMRSLMGIITLEDIMFYLDDMLELPQDFGGDIFNRIADELGMMGWRKADG